MFAATDTERSPWHVVPSDDKKAAHLNAISFLLASIPYGDVPREPFVLPPRQADDPTYVRPDPSTLRVIPQVYPAKEATKD